jgi:hypothetical protein
MVNVRADVELARDAGGGVSVLDAELAAGPVAIGVDGSLRHAELAGDLFRRQVLIDQPQAFTLAWGKQPNRIFGDDVTCAHRASS